MTGPLTAGAAAGANVAAGEIVAAGANVVAGAGSVSVNMIKNTTEAAIENGSTVTTPGAGSVTLTATDTSKITADGGGVGARVDAGAVRDEPDSPATDPARRHTRSGWRRPRTTTGARRRRARGPGRARRDGASSARAGPTATARMARPRRSCRCSSKTASSAGADGGCAHGFRVRRGRCRLLSRRRVRTSISACISRWRPDSFS